MGTNYYWYPNHLPHCSNCSCFDHERIHIGKSSFGWAFSLHVVGELDTLEKWMEKIRLSGMIADEYGNSIKIEDLFSRILDRPSDSRSHHNEHCVGHFDTYDLITGEFS